MKVLTVKQPLAYLICSDIKPIENRSWKLPEKYKGERVLIHASAKADGRCISHLLTKEQYAHLIEVNQGASAMDIMYLEYSNSAIIGSVRFVDCVVNHPSIWAEKSEPIEIDDFGFPIKYDKKIYNLVVADPILFDKPILNVKGKLGFWDYDLPEEYEKLLKL